MTIDLVREFLLWCLILNSGLLILWFVFFAAARDFIHRTHGRWFRLSEERFDAIHYAGMAFFKTAVVFFNLVPYVVLRIIG